MSHVVQIQCRIYDAVTVQAICERMKLPPPTWGTAVVFSGTFSGLLVHLPEWRYPLVIETLTGTVRLDNFEGRWGEQRHLDKFLQSYAVEKAKIEAHRKGFSVAEQHLSDGSVKLQILAAY